MLRKRKNQKKNYARAPDAGDADDAQQTDESEHHPQAQKPKRGQKQKQKQKRRPTETTIRGDIIFLLLKIAVLAVLAATMFLLVFGITRVPDDSMIPSVQNGDLVLYYRLQREYQANDVIVVKTDGELQVRRVIAIPGDEVDITPDGLKINGYTQDETNIYNETLPYSEGIEFPVKLADDEYFVLGDYRTDVTDSRIYGPVKLDDIQGSAMSILRRRNL